MIDDMSNAIAGLFSWSFAIGVVLGFVLSRAITFVQVCRADKRRHVEGQRKRALSDAFRIDMRHVAALAGVAFIGWSVFQTQANANESRRLGAEAAAFAERTQACQQDLIESVTGSRAVTTSNDALSLRERKLLAEGQVLVARWVGDLLAPPPDIADLDPNDPARQRYGLEVSRAFFNRLGEINREVDAIHREQSDNERSRPALPDPDCGK